MAPDADRVNLGVKQRWLAYRCRRSQRVLIEAPLPWKPRGGAFPVPCGHVVEGERGFGDGAQNGKRRGIWELRATNRRLPSPPADLRSKGTDRWPDVRARSGYRAYTSHSIAGGVSQLRVRVCVVGKPGRHPLRTAGRYAGIIARNDGGRLR